jgi:hypothetical protein
MQDLRKLERFDLKLPARIDVLNSDEQSLDLVTENVCAGGAFFSTPAPLAEGLAVRVELGLKRENGGGVLSLVTVGGKILRSQPEGMAIRFDKKYRITPAA